LHVLGADVLGAAVPVVVRVVALARHEPLEQSAEVLEEAGLHLVDAHAARRVRRVDASDPVAYPPPPDGGLPVLRAFRDGEASGRPQPRLMLEDLHRRRHSAGIVTRLGGRTPRPSVDPAGLLSDACALSPGTV